jgi:hypothetical protein
MTKRPRPEKIKLLSVDDLLTPEERKQLREDLAKMAKQRRDAEAFCRDWPLP